MLMLHPFGLQCCANVRIGGAAHPQRAPSFRTAKSRAAASSSSAYCFKHRCIVLERPAVKSSVCTPTERRQRRAPHPPAAAAHRCRPARLTPAGAGGRCPRPLSTTRHRLPAAAARGRAAEGGGGVQRQHHPNPPRTPPQACGSPRLCALMHIMMIRCGAGASGAPVSMLRLHRKSSTHRSRRRERRQRYRQRE